MLFVGGVFIRDLINETQEQTAEVRELLTADVEREFAARKSAE